MNRKFEKYLVLSGLFFLQLLATFYVVTLIESTIFALLIGVSMLILSVVASFRLIEAIYPKPENFSLEQVKSFFSSKTFWIGFAFLVINGIFPSIGLGAEEQKEMMALDWTNIVQALMGAALIIIRKLSDFNPIQ